MFTYLFLTGQVNNRYLVVFGFIMVVAVPIIAVFGPAGWAIVLSDILIGLLSLFSRRYDSEWRQIKFVAIGYLIIAGPGLIWQFGDQVHPSTWVGKDPTFAYGYLSYIGGLGLNTVDIDRAYYVPNAAKTNAAAKKYQQAVKQSGIDEVSGEVLKEFRDTLVKAEGLSASIVPNKILMNINGIDPQQDLLLVSVKGTLSVRGTNNISQLARDVYSDDFRYNVLDYKKLSGENSYVLPLQTRGLGYGREEIFENQGPDLDAYAAEAFSHFIGRVGSN